MESHLVPGILILRMQNLSAAAKTLYIIYYTMRTSRLSRVYVC